MNCLKGLFTHRIELRK